MDFCCYTGISRRNPSIYPSLRRSLSMRLENRCEPNRFEPRWAQRWIDANLFSTSGPEELEKRFWEWKAQCVLVVE